MAVALVLAVAPPALAATQYKYRILHTFTGGKDGGLLASGPALDGKGNAYGTTYWGGTGTDCSPSGCGVAYQLVLRTSGGWKENVLFNFTRDTGANPPQLLPDSAGDLFGSTVGVGGPSYVFELTPGSSGWTFNPIYNEGGYCLVFDKAGDLYGCIGPGAYKSGAIGELSPGSGGWNYTLLYSFDLYVDGLLPQSPLSWDTNGNLYDTTLLGGNGGSNCPGSGGCGVAFRMTPNGDGTWTYHVLHRFADSQTDGYYPYAGLTVDASGAAYGVTSAGGRYGTGTFFKLTPSKSGLWKETILYQFPNCANGCGPASTLVPDKAGNLYGSGAGGLHCGYDCGTVFKFTPQTNGTWKYSVVHKFNGTDGAFPFGVVLDDKGNIFGTTMNGGSYNLGVAFEITPVCSSWPCATGGAPPLPRSSAAKPD